MSRGYYRGDRLRQLKDAAKELGMELVEVPAEPEPEEQPAPEKEQSNDDDHRGQ